MEETAYAAKLRQLHQRYESVCRRCGFCCGSGDDPCIHLGTEEDGKYHCKIYAQRLGRQITVSGKVFRCVPISDLQKAGTLDHSCVYNRQGL